jgi:predicted exporter
MSVAALAIVVIHVVTFGPAREADEGTAAHLWQILMAGQLPIIAVFAIRWLPKNPKPALVVLAVQAMAGLAAAAPVFYLGL